MSTLKEKSEEILNEKTTKILPENIKKDLQIFDVIGTLESQEINNQDKTITENGTYHADSGYTGLGTVTVNVSGGSSEGVKLFETEEEMQADPDAEEGDLAVVYRTEIQNWQEETEAQIITFPDTVTLSTVFTGNIYGMFRAVDRSVMFDAQIQLSAARFRFDAYTEEGSVQVQYSSTDGITYTKTSGESSVDCGTLITWEPYEDWDDTIGYFMQTGGNYFEGLYQYKTLSEQGLHRVKNDFETDTDNVFLPLNITIPEDITFSNTPGYIFLINEYHTEKDGAYCVVDSGTAIWGVSDSIYLGKYQNKLGLVISLAQSPQTSTSDVKIVVDYDFRLTDPIVQKTVIHYWDNAEEMAVLPNATMLVQQRTSTSGEYKWRRYFIDYSSYNGALVDFPMAERLYTLKDETAVPISFTGYGYQIMSTYFDYTNVDVHTKAFYNEYVYANTQLDATAGYVYEKTFYGKDGVEEGTLGNPDNTFADNNAKLLAQIQEKYNEMQPRVLTDADKEIDTNILFIPTKFDGTPLLDTSNVTNMEAMLQNCANLQTIPQLDTSNVTEMGYMFLNCTNLQTISQLNTSNVTIMERMFQNCANLQTIPQLDTSNVTIMKRMFQQCYSLTEIPLLNTSNVTDMGYMFLNCTNLQTISQLNTSNVTIMEHMFDSCTNLQTIPQLNTSNVTDMFGMFMYCTNLQTIPQLNTSNVTDMGYMFYDCSSLSNESLNNILAMCKNATKIKSNKTLKYISLSSEQANICKTLSNYSAFTSAGWTTGY